MLSLFLTTTIQGEGKKTFLNCKSITIQLFIYYTKKYVKMSLIYIRMPNVTVFYLEIPTAAHNLHNLFDTFTSLD